MNQVSFANFLGIAPATLNSIFMGRTKPTLNTVEAIINVMPKVNMTWLVKGEGEMLLTSTDNSDGLNARTSGENSDVSELDRSKYNIGGGQTVGQDSLQPVLQFEEDPSFSSYPASYRQHTSASREGRVQKQATGIEVKNIDKRQRKITEIRVFFDDQTYESFVPKK